MEKIIHGLSADRRILLNKIGDNMSHLAEVTMWIVTNVHPLIVGVVPFLCLGLLVVMLILNKLGE